MVTCVGYHDKGYRPTMFGLYTIATYPSVGGRREAHGCVFQGRKARGVTTNVYLRKMSEKPKRCGLQTLSVKGLGVLFTHGEGIRTSHVHYKGRQPLTKCVISCLRFVLLTFFIIFSQSFINCNNFFLCIFTFIKYIF